MHHHVSNSIFCLVQAWTSCVELSMWLLVGTKSEVTSVSWLRRMLSLRQATLWNCSAHNNPCLIHVGCSIMWCVPLWCQPRTYWFGVSYKNRMEYIVRIAGFGYIMFIEILCHFRSMVDILTTRKCSCSFIMTKLSGCYFAFLFILAMELAVKFLKIW
jgi:hypothetical protein